ncbi:4'-phosphopantetheinyl transferase B [Penicillium longicatenatum]|uniref:4'-phosphopantetheinyl transferase B n=1 Tax=Penicillium longicatenatum TaxID=1561947 RepID=UPI0025469174|nr:4'-phosphopantetheinyl transferase B [Penicillium longicatenatum]KAJ5631579.1 4'-phosphopantetheinyl transferase B [Penicillium longicatenatum]
MKPIPFPFALNIGTDVVHLPRITALLMRRGNYLTRFTRRILCDQEQRDFHHRFKESLSLQPQSQNTSSTPQRSSFITADMTRWLAGRFAAKEAARKAAPDGAASIGWKDVMVRVQEASDSDSNTGVTTGFAQSHMVDGVSRRPEIVYLGTAKDGSDSRVGRLSISHDGEYVVATVLAAG